MIHEWKVLTRPSIFFDWSIMSKWLYPLTATYVVSTLSLADLLYKQSREIERLKERNKIEKERMLTYANILKELHDYLEDEDLYSAHDFLHKRLDHHSEFFKVAKNAL